MPPSVLGQAADLGAPDGAWIDLGGHGTPLHFGHANGFPPGSYAEFLRLLTPRYRVATLEARPLWSGSDPSAIRDWEPLAGDLRDALEARGWRGGVGVGHSLGAVCSLRAAVEDPGLFRALVLVDPVLFTGLRAMAWRVMRGHGWVERTPIVAGAVRRRDRFASVFEARSAWRDKPLFRGFTDAAFEAYLDAGLRADGDGLALRYPKAWEAAIFRTTPADPWDWVRRSPVPTLVLRGEHSDTLTRPALEKCRRRLPRGRVAEVPGAGHMAPLERPAAVAEAVIAFLDEVA